MWLTNSSVGRKIVMSVTGLFLILFVTFHVLMNAVAIFSEEGYEAICQFLGANWYAVAATVVLAAGFVLHIVYAFWLTLQNRSARGNDRYKLNSRPASVEWASQNMLALGIVVIAFIIVHLFHFWAKMMLPELLGGYGEEGTVLIKETFACWINAVIYIVGIVALWFHMTHGFWSAMQSLGANNNVWLPRLRKISCCWATCACGLFILEVVVFTAKALGCC